MVNLTPLNLFLYPLAHVASNLGQKGAETARPYLQRLYKTRMTAYRDAIKEFSVGFAEGLSQDRPKEEEEKKKKG